MGRFFAILMIPVSFVCLLVGAVFIWNAITSADFSLALIVLPALVTIRLWRPSRRKRAADAPSTANATA